MNKIILILIIFAIILAILFGLLLATNFILYKTWGNNEHFYLPQNGFKIECDINLLQKPTNCRPITINNNFPNVESGSLVFET